MSYVHKGNFEKHIKSGSLHDWAKRKDASVPETKRDAVPKQGPLTQFVTDAAEKNYTKLFNTAFSLVMAEKPFSDFPCLIAMQKRNGITFMSGKDDRSSCATFVRFIAMAVKDDIKTILSSVNFFSDEMDGSEARITKEEKELVFCKVAIRGSPTELLLKCQKMCDFSGVDAQGIKDAFEDAFLTEYNIPSERFDNRLVSVCADGAIKC